GQVATSLIGYDAFQECDMVGISRPVVKHSFLVKQTEDIPQVLNKRCHKDIPVNLVRYRYRHRRPGSIPAPSGYEEIRLAAAGG
ncbi:hypothetical protein MJI20_31905, partial [Salmonella enterica subsp. enterica serovar Anatum]|nr:hypothetical protein [Salmonella enterica subsp. enterica serovar Anatum]